MEECLVLSWDDAVDDDNDDDDAATAAVTSTLRLSLNSSHTTDSLSLNASENHRTE